MKVQAFSAYILTTKYRSFETKSKFYTGTQYACDCKIQEIKTGRGKKAFHNASIFLTQEQFENRYLSKGDKILIKDSAKWVSRLVELKAFDPKNIQKCDTSMLKKDEKGKTYVDYKFYSYQITIKPEDYEVTEKVEECCYIQVGKAKFYIPEREMDNTEFCFFFDKDTYDKLQNCNMQVTDLNCYLHGNRKWNKQVQVQSAFDEDSNKYFANLIVMGE